MIAPGHSSLGDKARSHLSLSLFFFKVELHSHLSPILSLSLWPFSRPSVFCIGVPFVCVCPVFLRRLRVDLDFRLALSLSGASGFNRVLLSISLSLPLPPTRVFSSTDLRR